MKKTTPSFEEGHVISPKEHMDVINKHGKLGRFLLENTLGATTTLEDLWAIESYIRTTIMEYAIEMSGYNKSRLGIQAETKNEE